MKKTTVIDLKAWHYVAVAIIAILMSFLAGLASAEVETQDGRVRLSYNLSENDAIPVCLGFGYLNHVCGSVPGACVPDAQFNDALPIVSRGGSGKQRGICIGDADVESEDECMVKIAAHYGAIGLDRGHCVVADSNAVTDEEWKKCEDAAAVRGLAPSPDLDELPHFLGCLAFLDHKTAWPLREARDAGRRWLADDAAEEVDMTDDDP